MKIYEVERLPQRPAPTPPEVVRAVYAALAARDPVALAGLLADDVVFHVPGRSPNTGDHRGKSAVLALLAGAADATGGTMRFELGDLAVGTDHVMALAHYTARRGDATLDNHLCHVLRVREGRVVESWFYTGDQYAVDAFWNTGRAR